MIRCGDFGGTTAEDEPCKKKAGAGTQRIGYGPCKLHMGVALDRALPPLEDARQRAFLVAYCITANISRAALAAGVNRTTHYVWLEADTAYAAAYRVAKKIADDELEMEARRRAVHGVEEPIYQGGKKVGTRLVYSDTLMALLLKGSNPKYRERHEITGKSGGPIQSEVTERVLIYMPQNARFTQLPEPPKALPSSNGHGNGNGYVSADPK